MEAPNVQECQYLYQELLFKVLETCQSLKDSNNSTEIGKILQQIQS